MSPTRKIARPLLATMFITGGADTLRNPGPRPDMVAKAGLSDPDKLVKINGITQLVGGLALATGRLPRLSALALAGSLVPTTYVGHPFWAETDKAAKAQQQIQFFKNISMLGGLLLAAADTGGRESIPHAAGRVTRRAKKRAAKATKSAAKALPTSS
ncbi:MAG: DoxX family protein [Actinobacteria bacterium]|nr:DoxX family protein [Actinomycetota bacterium]MCA1720515.1 DoxX family protein [Actinomycetota bacterium]